MTPADLEARIRRLDELARGLLREAYLVQHQEVPLLEHRETREYVAGIDAVIAGVEDARAVLARAVQRVECVRKDGGHAG